MGAGGGLVRKLGPLLVLIVLVPVFLRYLVEQLTPLWPYLLVVLFAVVGWRVRSLIRRRW